MSFTSKVTYAVTLEYDPDEMTEAEAQYVALEGFPEKLKLSPAGSSRNRVSVLTVERIEGGVNDDGVPNQPRVSWR